MRRLELNFSDATLPVPDRPHCRRMRYVGDGPLAAPLRSAYRPGSWTMALYDLHRRLC